MTHRYPEGKRLRLPPSAHTHLASSLLPTEVKEKVAAEDAELPILYKGATYFPLLFRHDDLKNAYQNINETSGWTIESRGSRLCYVGEFDNGKYKIRIALHNNSKSPDLITAYPVSRHDRQNHSDFLVLDEKGKRQPPTSLQPELQDTTTRAENPKSRIKKIAEYFVANSKDCKHFYCHGCDGFYGSDSASNNDCLVPGHDEDCEVQQLQSDMRIPFAIECNTEPMYCHSSLDLGTFHFVLDSYASMSLVMECSDVFPYFKRYTLPWDMEQAKFLQRLAKASREYCASMARKNGELWDMWRLIRDAYDFDARSLKDVAPESVETISNGRRQGECEFIVLHPSERIGIDAMTYRFVQRNNSLLDRIRKVSAEVRKFNQEETDMEKARYESELASDMLEHMRTHWADYIDFDDFSDEEE